MKKLVCGICVMFLLTGTLVGCGAKVEEIPDMTLKIGETGFLQESSLGSWSYRISGDKWGGYEACGAHPLDWNYDNTGTTVDYREEAVEVFFDVSPSELEVYAWPYVDGTTAETEEVYGIELSVEKGETGAYSFELRRGGTYVYMIQPHWEETDYKGDGIFGLLVRDYASGQDASVQGITDVESQGGNELPDLEVSLRTEQEEYATDTNIIKYIFSNNTNEVYMTGEHFTLLELKEGKWVQKSFVENLSFKDIGYLVEPGEEWENEFNVKWCFEEALSPGEYKIMIDVWPDGKYYEGKTELTAEFVVIE